MILDCDRCKYCKKCYPLLKKSNRRADDLFVALTALAKRDYCVNNGKREWKYKKW